MVGRGWRIAIPQLGLEHWLLVLSSSHPICLLVSLPKEINKAYRQPIQYPGAGEILCQAGKADEILGKAFSVPAELIRGAGRAASFRFRCSTKFSHGLPQCATKCHSVLPHRARGHTAPHCSTRPFTQLEELQCLQYILTVHSVSIKSVLVLCFIRSAMLFYSVTSDSIIQMCWLSSSAPPGIVYLVLQQSPAQSRLADGLPSLLPSPMDHDTSWPGLVNCTHLVNKYIVTDHMNILHSITHVFCNSTSYM